MMNLFPIQVTIILKMYAQILIISELGKVEERHGIDMNFYLLPCKAETGLGSDILPQEVRKVTFAIEISKRSVKQKEAQELIRG